MRVRLYGRAFFVLKENVVVLSDILKSGNMRNYLKGGCYYGEWNREVV